MTFEERKEQVRSYLGKTVNIKIDRPVGYIHKKEKYTLEYPINYGFIPGVIGGDGEELDVYLLGVNEPVKEYECQIIGIAHRENDVEDKLVAAPIGTVLNQAEIAEAIHFQEKWYKTTVEALHQVSAGVILYRKNNGIKEYLLLFQTVAKIWSFPKGHIERGESEEQAALREVFEETGIKVTDLTDFKTEINYVIGGLIHKKVVLFAALTDCEPKERNKDEIEDYRYATADEAKELLHPDYIPIIEQLEKEL